MQINALMQTQLISALPELCAREALALMAENHFHHFPIVNNQCQLLGIVSDRDLLKGISDVRLSHNIDVHALMTPAPITITRQTSVQTAARMMLAHRISCLPVLEGERLVGILTSNDLLRMVADLPG